MQGSDRGRAGALVLNSTDAISGCRVLISQLELPGEPALGACPGVSAIPGGLDYFAGPSCPSGMTWATAGMLSARFPFVTPAGRTSACTGTTGSDMQLVDGGYSESSGLGTLAELAPELIDLVRAHNATVVRARDPFVVPLVVDLANGYQGDLTREPADSGVEPLIPASAYRAASGIPNEPATWNRRLDRALADPCGDAVPEPCGLAKTAVHQRVDGPVVQIAPRTEPEITAPLGWTLSEDSRRSLACDLRPDSTADGGRRIAAVARLLGGTPSPPIDIPAPATSGSAPVDRTKCPAPVN